MNFELTQERQMLQDGLRRFLRDSQSEDNVLDGLAEMGVIGALFSEQDGGFGGDGFDIALVFEELGRAGRSEPLLDTAILGGGILALAGSQRQKALIEGIIAGQVQLAFAHGEPVSRYDLSRVETSATRSAQGFVLEGRKSVVVNGADADHIIVSARTSGARDEVSGISLFLLPKGTDGVDLRAYELAGGGRAAEVTLTDVVLPEDALIGSLDCGFETIHAVQARAIAAISAEGLGLMETIKDLTTGYLKTRKQFGQPIGKFQALQHRMADMLIEIEQARSAVINLAGHLEAEPTIRDTHASATKNLIGMSAKLVTEESIQMHGGIGMTMEYDLGHLAKRLTMVDHRFGDTVYHLERFIKLAVV